MCCPVHENEPPRGRYVQQSQSKNSCLAGKQTYHHINKIYQILPLDPTQLHLTFQNFWNSGPFLSYCREILYYICKRLSKTAQYSWVDINFRQLFCPMLMNLFPHFDKYRSLLHVGAVHDALDLIKIGLFQSVCGQFKF